MSVILGDVFYNFAQSKVRRKGPRSPSFILQKQGGEKKKRNDDSWGEAFQPRDGLKKKREEGRKSPPRHVLKRKGKKKKGRKEKTVQPLQRKADVYCKLVRPNTPRKRENNISTY